MVKIKSKKTVATKNPDNQIRQFSIENSTFLFGVIMLMLISTVFLSFIKLRQYENSVKLVIHTNLVKGKLTELLSNLKDAETGQRGYLLTTDSSFLESYRGTESISNKIFFELDSLGKNHKEQQKNLNNLQRLVNERTIILKSNLGLVFTNMVNSNNINALQLGKKKMDAVRKQVSVMMKQEDELLMPYLLKKNKTAPFTPLFLLLFFIILILALLLFFLGWRKETLLRILAQQKANKITKASENRIKNLFQEMPAGLCILKGPEHIFEFANNSYYNLVGTRDIIGKSVCQIFPEVESQAFIRLLDSVYKTGKTFIGDEMPLMLNKSGINEQYVDFFYQAFKDIEGKIEGILIFAYNVTENVNARKEIEKNEQALQKIASHLKLATDSANVGIWSLQLQTQKLEWSALHKKMWGYDELRTNLNYEDWHKLILPEDKEKVFKKIDLAMVNQTVYDVEYRIGRADDETVHYMRSVGKYSYNDTGEAESLTRISIDITEQKQAEEKLKKSEIQFRIFADSIQNLAWIANANGWIYWYNQQWYDYTGTTLEEMEGFGWQTVHHPDHIKKEAAFFEEAWKKDEAFELTFLLHRHDGQYRWFLTRAYPVKDGTGTVERWIGTSTDITEQKSFSEALKEKVKERTQELQEKNIQLERTNAGLNSFTYIASHDLQEPLRKIQIFSKQIIAAERFTGQTLDYFNRIIKAGERMQNLIVSLLDFSRISATPLVFEPCNLNAIVEESKDDLQLSIAKKQAVVEYENLPIINGSHIQLSQLFTNLIDNAIKYSRPEIKPHIQITALIVEGNKIEHSLANQPYYHAIKIADNGIGFENEYAAKIFEIFQRLHGKNEYSGTGIGLAIVKKIVTNHNGFIVAEGIPGVGSTFTIYIPIT